MSPIPVAPAPVVPTRNQQQLDILMAQSNGFQAQARGFQALAETTKQYFANLKPEDSEVPTNPDATATGSSMGPPKTASSEFTIRVRGCKLTLFRNLSFSLFSLTN